MLSADSKTHDEPHVMPRTGLQSGDAADRKLLITCVPQRKTIRPLRVDTKKGEGEKKEESKFVTLLISHTLQIGVYCVRERKRGYRMSGFKVGGGGMDGCLLQSVFSGDPRRHSVVALWLAVLGV